MAHGGQSFTFDKIQLIKDAWAYFDSSNLDFARILKEGASTWNVSKTSIPYTKEKGVAPIDVRIKVQ